MAGRGYIRCLTSSLRGEEDHLPLSLSLCIYLMDTGSIYTTPNFRSFRIRNDYRLLADPDRSFPRSFGPRWRLSPRVQYPSDFSSSSTPPALPSAFAFRFAETSLFT